MTLQALPPLHPAAELVPRMSAEEYTALRESIREHGQIEPCVLLDGQLLDGRHRWMACAELGLAPKTRPYAGEAGSPITFVFVENAHRRHLTSGQLATIAAASLPLYAAEAKERQRAAGRQYGESHPKPASSEVEPLGPQSITPDTQVELTAKPTASEVAEIVPQPLTADAQHESPTPKPQKPAAKREPEAAAKAAKAVGTNRKYVEAAAALQEQSPDLFRAVNDGEMTLPAAKREAQKREAAANEAIEDAALRVTGRLAAKERSQYLRGYNQRLQAVLELSRYEVEPLAEALNAHEDAAAKWAELGSISAWFTDWAQRAQAARTQGLRLVGARNE